MKDIYLNMAKLTRRGFAVISLVLALVVIALIVVVAVAYLGRQESAGPGEVSAPIARAKGVDCLAQIKKVELQVHLYYVEKSQYPEDLSGLEGVSDSDLQCPVTNSIYLYDPSTGRISCPDHAK